MYNTYIPDAFLKDYIDCLWYFSYDSYESQSYSILPDGNFDLMYVFYNEKFSHIRLTGLWSKKVNIIYDKPTKIFGIRFKPAAILTIIKYPINEIVNNSILLNDNDLIPSIKKIEERFKEVPDVIEFIKSYYSKIEVENKIEGDIKLLKVFNESCGIKTITSISSELGISSRQLNRKVRNLIGMSPKAYLNILRFRNYCETGIDQNYFDQAHLIKDFNKLCDVSPKRMKEIKDVRFLQYKRFFGVYH